MRQDDYAKYAVFADSLEKSFGKKEDKVVAVKGVSLRVEKGELYGIIGPDGAGKTTLFRILATLMLPDSGTAYVDGFDISGDYRLIRDRLGYMPGKFSLYPDLTVKENLEFFASVFGTTIKENYHLIKDIYERLEPFEKRKASKLSGGMKQKLALCCALIHFPDILFLDRCRLARGVLGHAFKYPQIRDKRRGVHGLYGRSFTLRQDFNDVPRPVHRYGDTGGNHRQLRQKADSRVVGRDVPLVALQLAVYLARWR